MNDDLFLIVPKFYKKLKFMSRMSKKVFVKLLMNLFRIGELKNEAHLPFPFLFLKN